MVSLSQRSFLVFFKPVMPKSPNLFNQLLLIKKSITVRSLSPSVAVKHKDMLLIMHQLRSHKNALHPAGLGRKSARGSINQDNIP